MKPQRPAPHVLAELFGANSSLVESYVDLLAAVGVGRGLIGPHEIPRLWNRHILNCAVVAPVFRTDATVADIGSGAGLPGLVIAMARPDLRVTLIDSVLRRTTFLAEVVERLDLSVEVVRARAEELHGRRRFDYVTARAVAPLDRLVAWALPLCSPGGEVVALKGSSAQAESNAARVVLRRLRAGSVEIERYGVGVVSPPTTVVRIQSR